MSVRSQEGQAAGMTARHSYEGSCHCGAVKVTLDLSVPAEAIEVRACQCGFCRRHGGQTVSDPDGRVTIRVSGPGDLTRYRFAPGTADFLVCAHCGVYAGAVMLHDDAAWSVVNVVGLAMPEFEGRTPVPAHYDAETRDERVIRRKAKWTPTELHFGSEARSAQRIEG